MYDDELMLIRNSGVKDAYDVLSDQSKRAARDQARIAQERRGNNDQEQGFEEEFDPGAYSGSEPNNSDNSDEDDDHHQEPDVLRKNCSSKLRHM